MKDKIAIVTGGGSGIGRATCIELGALGATVIVSDINEYSSQKTCGLILEQEGSAIAAMADVSKKRDMQELIDQTMDQFGRIDILVNNAGIGGSLDFFEDYRDGAMEEVLSVNLWGVWYGMKMVLPIMKQQGAGSIVNVSSVAGLKGYPRMSGYVASKHAVIGLTRSASLEYAKFGIRVNAVCPTVIDTEMGRSYINDNPDLIDILKSAIPMKRLGEAQEVAKLIAWLCGDDNTFITGQAIAIDGGMTA